MRRSVLFTALLAAPSFAQQHATQRATPAKMYACQTAHSKAMAFCDSSKDFTSRVADLLGRLTTQEKISLMGAHGHDICAFEDGGVPRLDIPSYTWCVETNTGVSTVCLQEGKCATTFPSPAAMAASFNRSLWRSKGATQSTEQRALFNLGAIRRDSQGSPIGLNGWGPNINTVRDPKYGRNSELPSEDPTLVRHRFFIDSGRVPLLVLRRWLAGWLTRACAGATAFCLQNGAYAVEEVRGMQEGDDPNWPLKIHATLKHYTAYSVETNRFGFIGNASTYLLRGIYMSHL
jgi:beta-glucosidase-like glycosyl hydrolase